VRGVTGEPSRVLVMGGTGMLGHAAVQVLAESFEVVASVRDPDSASQHGLPARLVAFNAGDDDLAELLERTKPGAVLNAIGLVKQLPAGQSPVSAIRLNSLFPHELAEACAAIGARLVHVSTDCVFSGALAAPARYVEEDLPDARDVYGRSKLLGEVLEPPGLTLRTSIIGRELSRASGLLEWFASQDGERVFGFTNAHFSGFTTRELSRLIGRILRQHPDLSGLWHVAADPIDKYDLLLRLRDVLGLRCEVVPRNEPVINRALDASRFEQITGYCAPPWDEMLEEYRPHE
jgi:dTDP-4-dehydrorhamnose reductase